MRGALTEGARRWSRRGAMVAAVAMVACSGDGNEETSAWEPNQLAIPEVSLEEDLENPRLDLAGQLHVDGVGEQQDLRIDTTTGPVHVEVDSVTSPDFTSWNEDEVLVSIRQDAAGLSMSIQEDQDLLYLLEPAGPGSLSDEILGPNLVAREADLGPVTSGNWSGRLSSVVIRTDTGDVELFPGQPAEVTIHEGTFRAVLLSSYDMDTVTPGCAMLPSRLAYELLRVEPGTVDTTKLTRDAALDLAGAVCTPVGTGTTSQRRG